MPRIEQVEFQDQDFRVAGLGATHYEECTFTRCQFEKADLSEITFLDCEMEDCDLSLADMRDTALRDVRFVGCKLVGVAFHDCHDFLFRVSFVDCLLHLSSFSGCMLKHTRFEDCDVREADFSQANLSKASFINSDLEGAIFEQTRLDEADLRKAYNFHIDPEQNHLKKARFSLEGLPGLLYTYNLRIEH